MTDDITPRVPLTNRPQDASRLDVILVLAPTIGLLRCPSFFTELTRRRAPIRSL